MENHICLPFTFALPWPDSLRPSPKKLSRALISTGFAMGFCGDLYITIYDYSKTGAAVGRSSIDFFTALSVAYIVSLFVGMLVPWPLGSGFKLGRKPTTLIALFFLFVAAALATSTMSSGQAIAGRTLHGLGTGMLYVTVILWRVETSLTARRGRDVILIWIALTAGAALGSWIRFGFQYVDSIGARWRVPLALQFVALVVAVVFVCGADESWRWLLIRDQPDKARVLLSQTLAVDQSHPDLQQTYNAILLHQHRISTSRALFPSKNTNSKSPSLRPWRRLFLGALLQTMRAGCGIAAANWYRSVASQYFINYSYYRIVVAAEASIGVLASLIPYWLIDKKAGSVISPWGRRGLLLYTTAGLAAVFTIATVVAEASGTLTVDFWFSGAGEHATTPAMIVSWALFLGAYLLHRIGFGPIVDMYTVELAAGNARLQTLSICMAWGSAVDTAVGLTTAFGVAKLGSYFYLVWLGSNAVFVVLLFLLYPETQGRSLEMMDMRFEAGLPWLAGLNAEARQGRKPVVGSVTDVDEVVTGREEHGHVTQLESSQENLQGHHQINLGRGMK